MDRLKKNSIKSNLGNIQELFRVWYNNNNGEHVEYGLSLALSEALLSLSTKVAPISPYVAKKTQVIIESTPEQVNVFDSIKPTKPEPIKWFDNVEVQARPLIKTAFGYSSKQEPRLLDGDLPYKEWTEIDLNYSGDFKAVTRSHRRTPYSHNRVPAPFDIRNNLCKPKEVVLQYVCGKTNSLKTISRGYLRESEIESLCQRVADIFNEKVYMAHVRSAK